MEVPYDSSNTYFIVKGIEYQKNTVINNRLSAPLCLYLEITSKCPLGCAHCYKPEATEKKNLSYEDYESIILQAHNMGVFEIRLCGNEPVLSRYFVEICNLIKKLKMHLSINTSGRLNDTQIESLLAVEPDFVVVSLDAIAEVHDEIRHKGDFDTSYRILKLLKEKDVETRINCVLSRKTMPHIETLVETASTIPCGISFIPLRTMGKSSTFKSEESMTAELIRSCNKAITKCRLLHPEIKIEMFFDVFGGEFTAHHLMNLNTPCPAGKNGFVSAQGELFPCDWIRYLKEQFYCGNVLEKGLSSLWNDSKVLLDFQCIKRVGCIDCKFYLTRCYGGCWCSYSDTILDKTYIDHLCPIQNNIPND